MKFSQVGLKALALVLFVFSANSISGQTRPDGNIGGPTAPKTGTASTDIGGQNQQKPKDTKPFDLSSGIITTPAPGTTLLNHNGHDVA